MLASPFGVEAEQPRIDQVGCCESFTHIINNPRVGSRNGSVGYTDRGLVDRDRVGILLHEYMVDERALTRPGHTC